MKTFFVMILVFIVSTIGLAQISVFNENGTDTRTIRMTYDIDSAATLTTSQFSLHDFDGGISATHPATFYFDHDLGAAPADTFDIEIILWGVYNGSSYTYPLDTIIAHADNQGVDDSLGVLTLNQWSADAYYITIDNDGGDGSGFTSITFPLREHARVSDIDQTH